MGSPRAASALLRRLEDRIAEEVEGQDRVVLAYSGGLASTLVAMIARKRCDLECIVAGTEGSPDARAGRAAKDYFDYRLECVLLNAIETWRVRGRVAMDHPRLKQHDIDTLVPLHAVLERARGALVLCGFGSPRLHADVVAALRGVKVSAPLHFAARGRALPRGTVQAATATLGLPLAWSRAPHRTPAAGAGIERFLRATANGLRDSRGPFG